MISGILCQCRFVPHALVRLRQINVGCAFTQIVENLATVDFRHIACQIKHRNNQTAIEMLVAAFSIDANLFKRRIASPVAFCLNGRRKPQCAVKRNPIETGNQFRMI